MRRIGLATTAVLALASISLSTRAQVINCPEDCAPPPNGDGVVNIDDLTAVITNWGHLGGLGDVFPPPNGDGIVNIDDLVHVIRAWGLCPPRLGACCLPGGFCTIIDETECLLANGLWHDGIRCDTCAASLGNAIAFPGDSAPIDCVITNTGPCDTIFDWMVMQTGGSATVTFVPGSGTVTINSGQQASVPITINVAPNSSLGTAGITLSVKVNGEEHCLAVGSVIVTKARLKQLEFTGTKFHGLANDKGAAYAVPHWQDNNGDGDANDMGDRRIPVSYTRTLPANASRVAINNVVFTLQTGVAHVANVPVRGTAGNGDMYAGTGTVAADLLTVSTAMTASADLPGTVKFYNTYDVTWEVALDGTNYLPAGTSDNRVYVTLKDPDTPTLYESVMDIACRNSDGQNTDAGVASSIYAQFTTRSVKRKAMDGLNKADGKVMRYWVNNNDPLLPLVGASCQTVAAMLDPAPANPALNGIGTCLAWSELLEATFDSHRLRAGAPAAASVIVEVTSSRANDAGCSWGPGETRGLLLVKNWMFAVAGGTAPAVCTPFDFLNTEVTDQNGAPAQGASTDPPPAFFNHFIIKFGGQFYDPSYGTAVQANQTNWEQVSLDGYRKLCGDTATTCVSTNARETAAVETTFNP